MNPVETLKAVLCEQDGKCCIAGSEADRKVVDEALAALDTAQPEPDVNAMLVEALEKCKIALEWVIEQGGGPVCEHEGAVCFCKENNALNFANAALTAAKQAQPERAPSSDYQATFNAIADAAKQGANGLEISVSAFWKSYNAAIKQGGQQP